MSSSSHSSIFLGIVLVGLGLLFLLQNFDIISVGDLISHFWPVFLILIGLYMIGKSTKTRGHKFHINDNFSAQSETSHFAHSATFGDINAVLESKDFQGGNIYTTFGDIKIDLRNLIIEHGEKRLSLNTVFGDVRIHLKQGTPIKIIANNTAGGLNILGNKRTGFNQSYTYSSENYDAADAKLLIVCKVNFGEIEAYF